MKHNVVTWPKQEPCQRCAHVRVEQDAAESPEIFWCLYCTVERVDPDYYPFCGRICSIHAEHS